MQASNVAHKAVIAKSEKILGQALEKAEIAREESRHAGRQAAENAAHAAAQEEVSTSQADATEQVPNLILSTADLDQILRIV